MDITIQKNTSAQMYFLWYVKQCINLGDARRASQSSTICVNVADIWRERYITLSREVLSAKIRDTLVVTMNGKKHSK